MDEVKKVMDHTDDLTHERVVDTLLADMRGRGVKVANRPIRSTTSTSSRR